MTTNTHKWVKYNKCTYFLFHLLCDILHVQSAGWLTRFIIFKHRHPFYLCFKKREEEKKTRSISKTEHHRAYLYLHKAKFKVIATQYYPLHVLFKTEWIEELGYEMCSNIKAMITRLIPTPFSQFILDRTWTFEWKTCMNKKVGFFEKEIS